MSIRRLSPLPAANVPPPEIQHRHAACLRDDEAAAAHRHSRDDCLRCRFALSPMAISRREDAGALACERHLGAAKMSYAMHKARQPLSRQLGATPV